MNTSTLFHGRKKLLGETFLNLKKKNPQKPAEKNNQTLSLKSGPLDVFLLK